MKKIFDLILVPILICFILVGCGQKEVIGFDDLIDIQAKDEWTWDTFKKYTYTESESGLYYRYYNVEGSYRVVVSGRDVESTPFNFYLEDLTTNEKIDLKTEDIITFLGDDY